MAVVSIAKRPPDLADAIPPRRHGRVKSRATALSRRLPYSRIPARLVGQLNACLSLVTRNGVAPCRNNHQVATRRTTPVSSSYSEYTERPSVYSFGHCRQHGTEPSRLVLSPAMRLEAHFPSLLSTGSGVRTRESLTDTWMGPHAEQIAQQPFRTSRTLNMAPSRVSHQPIQPTDTHTNAYVQD